MMMYEMFISAIPSFVLSLQPNTERVKGKFIPFVISRALPGAVTMSLGVLSVYVISQIPDLALHFGFTGENGNRIYQAVMMLVLTFTGLVMLYRICQPFNVWRTVLFVFSAALCILVISIPFFGEIVFTGWSSLEFQLSQTLLIIIVIQAALPLSGGLIKFFDMFNPAED